MSTTDQLHDQLRAVAAAIVRATEEVEVADSEGYSGRDIAESVREDYLDPICETVFPGLSQHVEVLTDPDYLDHDAQNPAHYRPNPALAAISEYQPVRDPHLIEEYPDLAAAINQLIERCRELAEMIDDTEGQNR